MNILVSNKRCILIADDEPKMVRALKDLFSARNFFVIEAYDGSEALEKFSLSDSKADIVLLDVMMPEMSGFEVAMKIRNSGSLVPIIMLTARGEEYDQLQGFNSGADDYISKPFSPSVLLARVEALLRRVGKSAADEINAGALCIKSSSHTAYVNGEEINLTRREFDLLYFLAVNKHLIFTREQLLDNVWGFDYEGSPRTVDTHIKQLRIKLCECAPYIKTVHCVGYQFEVQNEK